MKKVVSIVLMCTMLISLFTIGVNADNAVTGENNSVTKIENTFDEFTVTNDSNTNKYQGGGNFEHKAADDDSDGKYVQVNKEIPSSESQVLYGNPATSNFKKPAVGDKYIYKADFNVVGPEDGNTASSGVKFGAMLITDHWGMVDLGIQYEYGNWLIGGTKVTNPFGDTVVEINKWHTLNAVAEVKNTTNDAVMEVTYYLDGVVCATKGTATIAKDRTISSVGICNLKNVHFASGYTVAFDNFVVAIYDGNTDLIPTTTPTSIPVPEVVVGANGNVTKILNTFEGYTDDKYEGGTKFAQQAAADGSDGKYVQVNTKLNGGSDSLYAKPDSNRTKFNTPAAGNKYIYRTDFKIVAPEGGNLQTAYVKFSPMLITDYWGIVDLGIKYEVDKWKIGGEEVESPFGNTVVNINNWHTLNAVAEVKNIKDDATTMEVTYYLDGVECATKGTATIAANNGLRPIASVGIREVITPNYEYGYTLAFDNFAVATYEGNTDLIPKRVVPQTVINFDDYDDADAWYTWKNIFEKIETTDRTYIRAKAAAGTTLYRNDLFTNKRMGELAVGKKYIYSVDFMIEDINGNASWPVAFTGVTLTPMVMGNWQGRNLGVSIPTGVGKGVMVYNDTNTSDLQFDYMPDGTETGTQFYTTGSTFDEKLREDTWYTLTCVFEITGDDGNNFTGTTVSYINGERLAKADGTGWADSTFTWNKLNTSYLSQPALYANSGNLTEGHVLALDNLTLAVYEDDTELIPVNAAKLNMQEGLKLICDKTANTATATVRPLALKEDTPYWLFVAAYDGKGTVTNVEFVPYTAELGKFAEKTAVLENISSEATYVKAFIWSKDDITPLTGFVSKVAPSLLEE